MVPRAQGDPGVDRARLAGLVVVLLRARHGVRKGLPHAPDLGQAVEADGERVAALLQAVCSGSAAENQSRRRRGKVVAGSVQTPQL